MKKKIMDVYTLYQLQVLAIHQLESINKSVASMLDLAVRQGEPAIADQLRSCIAKNNEAIDRLKDAGPRLKVL
jgi:hypothetical protein